MRYTMIRHGQAYSHPQYDWPDDFSQVIFNGWVNHTVFNQGSIWSDGTHWIIRL